MQRVKLWGVELRGDKKKIMCHTLCFEFRLGAQSLFFSPGFKFLSVYDIFFFTTCLMES